MIRESVRMALRESEGSSVYMDYDSFYEGVVEELNSEVDKWVENGYHCEWLKDDAVPEYAERFVEKNVGNMTKYIESGNYNMNGNFAQIDINYEHDHKDGPRFDEVVRMIQSGEKNEYTEEFKNWTVSWFWYAFGTFGLTYNFSQFADNYMEDYMDEDGNLIEF